MKRFLTNAFAVSIVAVTVAAGVWMGAPWAVFVGVMTTVFITGYTISWLALRAAVKGVLLAVVTLPFLAFWLYAGYFTARATYATPVLCGGGFGVQPFREVAGAATRSPEGRIISVCLPRPGDVLETMTARITGG